MMDGNWIQLGEQAIWDLVGAQNRGSPAEWILLSLAVVALILVFSRVSQMTDIPVCGPGISLVVIVIGVGALAASWLLVDRWLLPMADVRIPRIVERGIAIALSLGVTVPVMCLMMRTHIHKVLMAWGGGLLAAALLLWLGHLSIEAISAGSEGAQRTKERSEEMQEFLNKN